MTDNISIIANNYINGNISDFKLGLTRSSKKQLLLVIVSLAEYLAINKDYQYKTYSDNEYSEAIQIVYKNL